MTVDTINIDRMDDLMEELRDRVHSLYYAWEGYKNDMFIRVPKHAENLKKEIVEIETLVKGVKNEIVKIQVKGSKI